MLCSTSRLKLIFSACLLFTGSANAADTAFKNSVGMEFVLVPAGSYLMGSSDELKDAAANEKPRHPVTISKAFYMGKYEVTQAQWEAVMGESPFAHDRSNSFYGLPGMAERLRKPDNPATVSWKDAQEFNLGPCCLDQLALAL